MKEEKSSEKLLHSEEGKFIRFWNVLESSENNFCICKEILFQQDELLCCVQAKEISTQETTFSKIMFYDSCITTFKMQ